MNIRFGKTSDIDSWMSLVDQVKDSFPGLETEEAIEEHRKTVLEFINNRSAICAVSEGKITGVLLFSREENMICFLAVSGDSRRQHIAEKMVSYMLTQLDKKKDVVVSTYCEGVPEGIPARAFYKRMGFTQGEITEEFGSPVQVFTLKR